MKLADFLYYVILVLLEVIISNCISHCVLVIFNVRKYSFAYRVIDIWNCLSSDIVSTDNICTFRAKLDSLDLSPFYHVHFT